MFSNYEKELFPEKNMASVSSDRLKALLPESLRNDELTYKVSSTGGGAFLSPKNNDQALVFSFTGETYEKIINQLVSKNKFLAPLKDRITPENIGKIMYRTQTSVKLNKADLVDINGLRSHISDLYVLPRNFHGNDSLQISPHKFPNKKPVTFKFGNAQHTFQIQQQRDQTTQVLKRTLISSVDSDAFKVILSVPDNPGDIKVDFTISLFSAKKITELKLLSNSMVNLIDGKTIRVGTDILGKKNNGYPNLKPLKATIKLFVMLYEIGKRYHIKFPVTREFKDTDVNQIRALYETVIRDKIYYKIPTIVPTWTANGVNTELQPKQLIGKIINITIAKQDDKMTILGKIITNLVIIRILYQYKVIEYGNGNMKIEKTNNSCIFVKVLDEINAKIDINQIEAQVLKQINSKID